MVSSTKGLTSDSIVTIERHILEQQRYHPEATGMLTSLLYDLALAGKMIASQMSKAGLAQILRKNRGYKYSRRASNETGQAGR